MSTWLLIVLLVLCVATEIGEVPRDFCDDYAALHPDWWCFDTSRIPDAARSVVTGYLDVRLEPRR